MVKLGGTIGDIEGMSYTNVIVCSIPSINPEYFLGIQPRIPTKSIFKSIFDGACYETFTRSKWLKQ